jgi:hypothetical protein
MFQEVCDGLSRFKAQVSNANKLWLFHAVQWPRQGSSTSIIQMSDLRFHFEDGAFWSIRRIGIANSLRIITTSALFQSRSIQLTTLSSGYGIKLLTTLPISNIRPCLWMKRYRLFEVGMALGSAPPILVARLQAASARVYIEKGSARHPILFSYDRRKVHLPF